MNKALMVACSMLISLLPLARARLISDRGSSGKGDIVEKLARELLGDDLSGAGPRRGFGFLLRSGDATVAVRCDPRDTMKACVEATTTLLEKAHGAASGATLPK